MSYELSALDIEESLGYKPEVQQPTTKSANLAQMVMGGDSPLAKSGLMHFGAHALTAPLNTAENIANLPAYIAEKFGKDFYRVNVPEQIKPSSYLKDLPDTPTTRGMGKAGELVGDVVSGMGVYGKAAKALKMGGATSLKARAALGAGVGAASAPDEYRELGGALGAGAPLIAGMTVKGIGSKAGDIATKAQDKYKALYDKIMYEAEKSGASKNIKVPEKMTNIENIETLYKNTPSKFNASVKKFTSNPTFKNAHKAQSDLGKIISNLEGNLSKNKTLSSSEYDALNQAKDLQKRIRGSMSQALEKSKRPDLIKDYEQATKGYKEEVAPYKLKELKQFQAGKGTPKKAGKELLQDPKFAKSDAASKLPGYEAAKYIQDLPAWVKILGVTGAGEALSGGLRSTGVPSPSALKILMESIK